MPTPDVIDFAVLLAPIPGDKPTGVDLRANAGATSLYYQVKDARSAARAAERQMEAGAEDPAPPDWKAVVKSASKALGTATKDLEIAAYLIEALLRTNGFAGLRDGFKLVRGYVETYWDDLYPTPDEEGILTRVAPLTGLNGDDAEGTLIAPINRVAFTDSASHGYLTLSNYMQAVTTNKILDPKVKEKKIADGAMSFDKFKAAVDETSPAFFRTLHDDMVGALDAFAAMSAALDVKCGPQAPPGSAIRTSINAVLDAVKDVARDKLAVTQAKAAEEAAPEAESKGKSDTDGGKDEPGEKLPVVRNREDALNAILKLSEYFRRTEPHSLVPHALEQAVRWGRMPLGDLLSELIPDDDARSSLFKQVGIRGAADSGTEEKKKKR